MLMFGVLLGKHLAPEFREPNENTEKDNPMGSILSFFGFVFGLAIVIIFWIFWMVIAWRLMRSNERLAETVERLESRFNATGGNTMNRNE
jgi:hypothetical protein